MATFIQVPSNLDDSVALRRFLEKLILQLDIAFGNRGNSEFITTSSVQQITVTATYVQNEISQALLDYIKKNGDTLITDTLNYDDATTVVITNDEDIPHKKYVDDNFISSTNNTTILTYDSELTISNNTDIPHKKYVDDKIEELKPEQSLISALNQTIGGTYSQTEVQDISDKVDEILAALKSANIISDV